MKAQKTTQIYENKSFLPLGRSAKRDLIKYLLYHSTKEAGEGGGRHVLALVFFQRREHRTVREVRIRSKEAE